MALNKFIKSLAVKKLINSRENKISYIQFFGFLLILYGVITITVAGFNEDVQSSVVAISFFLIMLGIAFAFPSLLKGNEGLSTMRIVVFMVVNVICLLLLKIGWGKEIKSLDEIKLDQYWLGVIAFVFGAKATQSFFESKFAVPSLNKKKNDEDDDSPKDPFMELSGNVQKSIINEFIAQESQNLKIKYPELQGLSALQKEISGVKQSFYSIHFSIIKKSQVLVSQFSIPSYFPFKASDGIIYNIPTDITGIGVVSFSYYTGNGEMPKKLGLSCSRQLAKRNGIIEVGSIGLKVLKDKEPYLLSCYHVLYAPEFSQGIINIDNNVIIADDSIISPGDYDRNGDPPKIIAHVTEGIFTNYVDAAIAKLLPQNSLDCSYYNDNGKPVGILRLTENHAKNSLDVKIVGRTSGLRVGHIIDNYEGTTFIDDHTFNELIVCSKMSDAGDSGATVTDFQNNVIGMLLADSDYRSYIIPIESVLNTLKITIDFKNS